MRLVPLAFALLSLLPAARAAERVSLTQAMADPDWIGNPVERAWWGWDGKSAYYLRTRDGASIRPLLPQTHVDPMRLRMLGGIGRGLADNLQKCGGDTRVLRQRTLNIDLHTHQAKSMDDITQLLCRLAGTATAQIGGD